MVKLFCAVVGVGGVFPADIDISETVGDLQVKIKEKEEYGFPASKLKLYLAREGDKWLNSRDEDVKALKKGEIPDRIKNLMHEELLLDEASTLDDEDYFCANFTPKQRDIHVLVKLPEDVGRGVRDDSLLARIEQKIDHLNEKSTTDVYDLSKISSAIGSALRQQLHIHLVTVKTVPCRVGASRRVEPFECESVETKHGQDVKLNEEQHRKPFLAYVERNIGAVLSKENLCVFGVEHQNLFQVKIPGHNIKLSGWTDLLILSDDVKKHPHRLEELPDVRMLVDVKQEVKSGASSQTTSELIALDLVTAAPVMALLTDLNKTWQFFWVSEKSNDSIIIHTAVFENPGDAFEVIRTLLQQPSSVDAGIQLACFERPIKRRKLAPMLPLVGESGEVVDIRDAIERYYDIASVLGPDIQMARAVANQITQAIPAFSGSSVSYSS